MYQDLLVLLLSKGFLRGYLTRLDDDLVKLKPDGLSFQDFLFHSGLGDEAIDVDLLFLAYSVGSVHRLKVDLRVPV
jgi:hypothetical protein